MKFDSNTRLLILAPHIDDETIGCGGLIQIVGSLGGKIFVLFGSHIEGDHHKLQDDGTYKTYSGSDRMEELQSVLRVLSSSAPNGSGVVGHGIMYLGEAYHHKLDTVPLSNMLTKAEDVVANFMPNLIVAPFPSYDQDHKAFYELATAIARPHHYKGSVLLYSNNCEIDFVPNCFIELTDEQFNRKIDAIAMYETQKSGENHAVSRNALEAACSLNGKRVFSRYAEAYCVYRLTMFSDGE